MCKCLSDWLCCCLKGRRSQKKKTKKNKKLSISKKYGTDWETRVEFDQRMSPSMIDDNLITKDVVVDQNLIKTETDRQTLYDMVLTNYQFDIKKDLLGTGSFGDVYKIRDKKSGEVFALKIMSLNEKNNPNINLSKSFQVFKNEVFCLRKSSHQNIIKIYEHFILRQYFLSFIIMEFATQGDLLKRLSRVYNTTKWPFSESESKTYFTQMANAMHFVHMKGISHGDFKLDNVLITKTTDGREVIKITDFGCARVAIKADERAVKMRKAVGTVVYMAPEQLRVYLMANLKRPEVLKHSHYSYNPIRADVWALGVSLFRMLCYQKPFDYSDKDVVKSILAMIQKQREGCKPPERIVRQLSAECLDLLNNLLEYNKNKRIDMNGVLSHKWLRDSPLLDKKIIFRKKLKTKP